MWPRSKVVSALRGLRLAQTRSWMVVVWGFPVPFLLMVCATQLLGVLRLAQLCSLVVVA